MIVVHAFKAFDITREIGAAAAATLEGTVGIAFTSS